MAALGGYLRTLREEQHISRSGLAGDLNVDATTLWRIEEGKQEPSGSLLITLVAAIRGSYDDVRQLLTDKNATVETARDLATARLALDATPDPKKFVADNFTESDLDAIRRKLAEDPDFLDMLTESIGRQVLKRRI